MARSKYEYVKAFEREDKLLPNTWIVVRVDGKGFHKFTKEHQFIKPNDVTALQLMNHAASAVMKEIDDLTLAYGQSDEYSFLFKRDTDYYSRREVKLASVIGSLFTAHYILAWSRFFPDKPLTKPPAFDARAVPYPSIENVRDYFAWRQADCHINNLYNTSFWALVLKGGLSENAAMKRLSKTVAKDKNELLFSEFGINYNDEPEIFKKGSTLVKELKPFMKESRVPRKYADPKFRVVRNDGLDHVIQEITRQETVVTELHCSIIDEAFWIEYPQAVQ
ncbi:hypothetical protein AMAG_02337 [Allomyces macrogynus ATCC 38327]|uniref:tRNA(His) guanylyltransferase n=1 Tax=Allomyces macrogynus (strain ATCC 38327) TaxID=578462 RepID=A0A0L0S1U2_ALLM3|nr:hypothetical protein AMAG_02337 [Allomyces macrogynus ATCC 38327]|eukprot:KNE56537.1 hypothetical protein AMAG_02337 [Allomyces macrogynus ATCC 38327]